MLWYKTFLFGAALATKMRKSTLESGWCDAKLCFKTDPVKAQQKLPQENCPHGSLPSCTREYTGSYGSCICDSIKFRGEGTHTWLTLDRPDSTTETWHHICSKKMPMSLPVVRKAGSISLRLRLLLGRLSSPLL